MNAAEENIQRNAKIANAGSTAKRIAKINVNAPRIATIIRKTSETDIALSLKINGNGKAEVETGIGFLNHMLCAFAKHGLFDLEVRALGDLEIDQHHMIEDLGITLGMAFVKALGGKQGIARAGMFAFPMDETLSLVSVDFSGRSALTFDAKFEREFIGGLQSDLVEEFFAGFSQGARCNVFVRVLYDGNDHHKCEGMFKGFGRACEQACAIRGRARKSLPSTKGMI